MSRKEIFKVGNEQVFCYYRNEKCEERIVAILRMFNGQILYKCALHLAIFMEGLSINTKDFTRPPRAEIFRQQVINFFETGRM